jgi:hypothetical protein
MITITPEVAYFVLAVIVSAFLGATAPQLFRIDTTNWQIYDWIHQFWLNFTGSLLGWISLWAVGSRLLHPDASAHIEFGSGDLLLAILGFIGITGFLPMATITVVKALDAWAKNKIAGLAPNGKGEKDE